MKILVVISDKNLACAIGQILLESNHTVDIVNDGIDGYKYALSNNFDCIVIDNDLPRKNGHMICTDLRSSNITTPIIMLTSIDQNGNKIPAPVSVTYLAKPFSPNELLSSLSTLTNQVEEYRGEKLSFNDVDFYVSLLMLKSKESNKTIKLTSKEGNILKLFLSSSTTVSKNALLPLCNDTTNGKNLNAYISFLVNKLSFLKSRATIVAKGEEDYELIYEHN